MTFAEQAGLLLSAAAVIGAGVHNLIKSLKDKIEIGHAEINTNIGKLEQHVDKFELKVEQHIEKLESRLQAVETGTIGANHSLAHVRQNQESLFHGFEVLQENRQKDKMEVIKLAEQVKYMSERQNVA